MVLSFMSPVSIILVHYNGIYIVFQVSVYSGQPYNDVVELFK